MTGSETNRGTGARARDLRRVEHAVARILANTELCRGLRCDPRGDRTPLRWELGSVWEADLEGLHAVRVQLAFRDSSDEFQALTDALTLDAGEGLPGYAREREAMAGGRAGGRFPALRRRAARGGTPRSASAA